jgi:hypothetical protein
VNPSRLDSLRSLGRSTAWELVANTQVHGDVGHPQGLCRRDDGWLVTTVHVDRHVGEVLIVSGDGDIVRRVDVTDGARFHPGGFHVADVDDGVGCWVAVAEYRPRSTTRVIRLDDDLCVVASFLFDDHLGAVCPLADGTLFAVSWASRRWYRLDTDGRILDHRTTPTRWIDLQDIACRHGQHVVATGVGELAAPSGRLQIGGLQQIDVDGMRIVHDAPVAAWMPSGRAATYNGAHLDFGDGGEAGGDQGPDGGRQISLSCIVDDTRAVIGTWTTRTPYVGA